MTALTDAAQAEIEKIQEKLEDRRGEIILASREITTRGESTGDLIGSRSDEHQYYETGIIDGDLSHLTEPQMKTIKLPISFLRKGGDYGEDEYHYFPEISIPVERKLSGFLPLPLAGFRFETSDLEQLADGQILIALNELSGKAFDFYRDGLRFFFHAGDKKPSLSVFGLYIGDNEVFQFLNERKVKNIDEIVHVLKSPEYVAKRIDRDYFEKRKKLTEELTVNAGTTAIELREVKSIERSVMDARWVAVDHDLDHGYAIYGWDDFHSKSVKQYLSLREEMQKRLEVIGVQLEQGNKLYSDASEPLIDGTLIGFPAKMKFPEYANWLNHSFIPRVGETIGNLDFHLREERAKEKSR